MADRDVLELANDEEFGGMEEEQDDETVSKLMDKAKRRKGRGFTGGPGETRDVVSRGGWRKRGCFKSLILSS